MATAETARRNPGGRPAIGPQIAIAFPPDMLARVDAAARAAGVSRAEWIRRAVVAALPSGPMLRLTDTTTGETATVMHDRAAIAALLRSWLPDDDYADQIDAFAAEMLRYRPAHNRPGQVSTPVAAADAGVALGIRWEWV